VGVRYTIEPDRKRQVVLKLHPFVSLRDFHQELKAKDANISVQPGERHVTLSHGSQTLHVWSDGGQFFESKDWWYDHYYAVDADRGLGSTEDLFTPGAFVFQATGPTTITLWASMEPRGAHPGEHFDWDAELRQHHEMIQAALTDPENLAAAKHPPLSQPSDSPTIRRLVRAANDFIVYRKSPQGADGTTIIAGYPWFADWGRDTMISLPGLLLTTGRFHQARQVLGVFAQYVSEGMIPNRFDDYTNEPHYNTVDASLWFIHACFEYLRLSRDKTTFERTFLPACRAIVRGYREGTRFQIKMDPSDGLITQGDAHTQLTWMDAKCGDIAFTPRQGKPVEINALWHHALKLMGEIDLAARVATSFQKAFWISPFRGLADVVEGEPGPQGYPRRDLSLRPNQIFAVSLEHTPLDPEQQRAVVEVVRRELLTPVGLRTLAQHDPGYRGHYHGTQFERDSSYHNGAVWPWLIGGFLTAYLRVHNRSKDSVAQARQWLEPLIAQMETTCIGQIWEIHEGNPPHRPVGCPAQAWSVAEVLRLAAELEM
jgi:predicted glycogen debranching enzyme